MKRIINYLCIFLVSMGGTRAAACAIDDDPIQSLLYQPNFLVQNRETIGLTDEQVEKIHSLMSVVGPQAQQHQKQLYEAMGHFAEILSEANVDEEKALQQLDVVLALEGEIKRLQFRMMIRVRNELTAEQRQGAANLRQVPDSPETVQRRLQEKIVRIQTAIKERTESGDQPFDAIGMLQRFPELMEDGQVQQAENLLDRVLELLKR